MLEEVVLELDTNLAYEVDVEKEQDALDAKETYITCNDMNSIFEDFFILPL